MDDYLLAIFFSVFVLVPLAVWKIKLIYRRLQKMFRRVKEEQLSPKQKELISFVENAPNQSINN
tara:strand:+ start:882 stop:1073 length:192 start_codon:yes stop_codon:yes gene_type:complete